MSLFVVSCNNNKNRNISCLCLRCWFFSWCYVYNFTRMKFKFFNPLKYNYFILFQHWITCLRLQIGFKPNKVLKPSIYSRWDLLISIQLVNFCSNGREKATELIWNKLIINFHQIKLITWSKICDYYVWLKAALCTMTSGHWPQ